MKKITIIFMCFLFLLTGCNNTENQNDIDTPTETINPLDPIKEEKIILVGKGDENFELNRIDSTNRSDADAILELANAALTSAAAHGSIEGLYFVPCGLANNNYSFDPIMIKTDDEDTNSDPVFMVVLMNDEEKTLIGTYRESELIEKDYRVKAIDVYETKQKEIRNKLGLTSEDTINFDLMTLLNLEIYNASSDFKKLYADTCTSYTDVSFAMWDGDFNDVVRKNDMDYPRLKHPDISSFSDLKKYLEFSFTSEVADKILDNLDPTLYLELNDKLYFIPIGIGGNVFIDNIEPIAMAEKGLTTYLVVECNIADDMDEYGNLINIHKIEYLFEYIKQDDGYKCNKFIDIPFGFFES